MKLFEFFIPFFCGLFVSFIFLGNVINFQSEIIKDLTGKNFYSYEDYRLYKLENKGG